MGSRARRRAKGERPAPTAAPDPSADPARMDFGSKDARGHADDRPDPSDADAGAASAPAGRAAVPAAPATSAAPAPRPGAAATPPAALPGPPPPVLDRALDDPLEVLYRSVVDLSSGTEPRVTVLIMKGRRRLRLRAEGGPLELEPRTRRGRAGAPRPIPEGRWLTVEARDGRAGRRRAYPIVAEYAPGDREGIAAALKAWRARGKQVRTVTVGSVFGISGRVLDNRRTLVLLDGPGDPAWAERAARQAARYLPLKPRLHEVLEARPRGRVVALDEAGAVVAEGDSLLTVVPAPGARVLLESVEFGEGYAWHGFEDRAYEGTLHLVADGTGLTVVNAVPMEAMLRGVVPAETYASAHPEALKAQAVTARTEVLSKIGIRHLADPAVVCDAQHCQVYKGVAAADPRTDAAVAATRGEVLVGSDGRLVETYYSAVCGGHTENNEVVWGGTPSPALRGQLDFDPSGPWMRFAAGIGEDDLEAWLESSPPAWCNLSSFKKEGKFRWRVRISADEMNARLRHLGVGRVKRIEVLGRGVSGRVKAVRIDGSSGSTVVHRELPVRRLFGNLNSGMFIVRTIRNPKTGEPEAFEFIGGGWGHGVGMCQTGAIGMAEHGYDYPSILRHYYNGASVLRIYGR
ncbi:MAG: SpoIID/LytB domain-containing protein [Deltaproteobacteria bacterium]|nr:MAG: SpoIID/LytB domain-containing protein [Deltaproteobacteria bacterium]